MDAGLGLHKMALQSLPPLTSVCSKFACHLVLKIRVYLGYSFLRPNVCTETKLDLYTSSRSKISTLDQHARCYKTLNTHALECTSSVGRRSWQKKQEVEAQASLLSIVVLHHQRHIFLSPHHSSRLPQAEMLVIRLSLPPLFLLNPTSWIISVQKPTGGSRKVAS